MLKYKVGDRVLIPWSTPNGSEITPHPAIVTRIKRSTAMGVTWIAYKMEDKRLSCFSGEFMEEHAPYPIIKKKARGARARRRQR